jgi:hypothetical protein
MSDNINMDGQVVPVIVQSYMDWERPAAINAEQKKIKKQNSASSKEISTAVTKMRGSYISKNEPKVVNLISLMQEFEHLSIREAAIKVGLQSQQPHARSKNGTK